MPSLAESPKAVMSRAPLPAELDTRAEAFHKLEEDLAAAKKKLDEARKAVSDQEAELIEIVEAFGGPHATKSRILHGILWEMVVTFGQYTTQDAAAVGRFRDGLKKHDKGRLLKKFFTQDVRWSMNAGAAQVAVAEKLPSSLMALLLACSVTQDRKPSLDVRPKKKTA